MEKLKKHRCIRCGETFTVAEDAKEIKCPNCGLKHEIIRINGTVYIRPSGEILDAYKIKSKRERRPKTPKLYKKPHKLTCRWCREQFRTSLKTAKYCGSECMFFYSKAKSRLLTYYTFQKYPEKRIVQELKKLEQQGKNYKVTP